MLITKSSQLNNLGTADVRNDYLITHDPLWPI